VLKAAWPWDSDSSVTDDKLAEPGRTTLYIIRKFSCGSVDLDGVFSHILWGRGGYLTGNFDS
jgi:hypothetical protein